MLQPEQGKRRSTTERIPFLLLVIVIRLKMIKVLESEECASVEVVPQLF